MLILAAVSVLVFRKSLDLDSKETGLQWSMKIDTYIKQLKFVLLLVLECVCV